MPAMRDPVIDRILATRGANKAIAEACGISTAAVSQWHRVPRKHLETVSQVTGVEPHELPPAMFAEAAQ